jgi:hypothetical protein
MREIAALHEISYSTLVDRVRKCNGDILAATVYYDNGREKKMGEVITDLRKLLRLCNQSIHAFCKQCPYLKRTICNNPDCELYEARIELRTREK